MAITKMYYDNKFVRLIDNGAYSIWGKIGEYHSTFNETYDVVNEIVILKGIEANRDNVFYKTSNIFFKLDSITDILDNVLTYITYTKHEKYNIVIALDRVFKDHKEIGLKIAVKEINKKLIDIKRNEQHEKEMNELNNLIAEVNDLTSEKGLTLVVNDIEKNAKILKGLDSKRVTKDFKEYINKLDVNDKSLICCLDKFITLSDEDRYNYDTKVLIKLYKKIQEYLIGYSNKEYKNICEYCKNKGMTKEEYKSFANNIKEIAKVIAAQNKSTNGMYKSIDNLFDNLYNNQIKLFLIQELKKNNFEFFDNNNLYRIV